MLSNEGFKKTTFDDYHHINENILNKLRLQENFSAPFDSYFSVKLGYFQFCVVYENFHNIFFQRTGGVLGFFGDTCLHWIKINSQHVAT